MSDVKDPTPQRVDVVKFERESLELNYRRVEPSHRMPDWLRVVLILAAGIGAMALMTLILFVAGLFLR